MVRQAARSWERTVKGANDMLPWDGDGDISLHLEDPCSRDQCWALVTWLNTTLRKEARDAGLCYGIYESDPSVGFGGFFRWSENNLNGLDVGATFSANPPQEWAMFRGRKVRMHGAAASCMESMCGDVVSHLGHETHVGEHGHYNLAVCKHPEHNACISRAFPQQASAAQWCDPAAR